MLQHSVVIHGIGTGSALHIQDARLS